MGRNYQDPDPLHGNGKAEPHPKRPTTYSFRHSAFRAPRRIVREVDRAAAPVRAANRGAFQARQTMSPLFVLAGIAAALGMHPGRSNR